MRKTSLLKYFLILFFLISQYSLYGQSIKGTVIEDKTKETLPGVTISVKNTSKMAVTDINGNFSVSLPEGEYTLVASYISYATQEVTVIVKDKEETEVNIVMKETSRNLGEVVVKTRRNMEAENALMDERKVSTIAVENLGSREMSIKGLSTVADGIKKVTGISMDGSSKLFVRGLGDRYSMTSLNGFPIASPNPDNKLIPLSLFPTSIVKNITINKVFQPSVFGDYSGAHIDIETKENIGKDYITFSFSTGGKINTVFSDFYSSDKGGVGIPYLGIARGLRIDSETKPLMPTEFAEYVQTHPFKTGFSIDKKSALPDIGIDFGMGKVWNIGEQKLNTLFAINFGNDYTKQEDAISSTIDAQGGYRNYFKYNKYVYETTTSMLGQVSLTLRKNDMLSYNIMYINNTEDSYSLRDGFADTNEDVKLLSSNSIYHIYALFNNQLAGKHELKDNLSLKWQGSYGRTTSDEPDRRQVIFRKDDAGNLSLYTYDQQSIMRYFGELFEDEWNGDFKLKYDFTSAKSDKNFVQFGASGRLKSRDFYSSRFYYNISGLTPNITDAYNTESYLNQQNIVNGSINIRKDSQPSHSYQAGADIYATFLETEYTPLDNFLVAVGLRYEHSKRWVDYFDQASNPHKDPKYDNDLFPAINLKYNLSHKSSLRLSASRTVTRPAFIEMADFKYQEAYGGVLVRGNPSIENGYNYNVDARYEIYPAQGDLISASVYYKHLDSPIERVFTLEGGGAVETFLNVDKGTVGGVELEIRKNLVSNFSVDFNASYIYTKINLPESGVYTDKKRELQGASPYLFNLDLNYSPQFSNDRALSLTAVYNLRGPRIHSVGIDGNENVIEAAFNSLDFVGSYKLNKVTQVKLQAKNLVNQEQKFTQEANGEDIVVKGYKSGTSVSIGFSLNF